MHVLSAGTLLRDANQNVVGSASENSGGVYELGGDGHMVR